MLVIDEAGMVSSRQLERIVSEVSRARRQVELVGDAQQLQPIEAGAAFRAIAERVGYFARGQPGLRSLSGAWRGSVRREPPKEGADRGDLS